MNSNFFTNEEENTLKNRINYTLQKDKNIEYLDFLIGYFRITGFDKISDNLKNIKKIRLIIGIDTDKPTYQASQLIHKFANEQIAYTKEPLDLNIFLNFLSMRELIIDRRIEIKIAPNRAVHSKMYIMRDEGGLDHTQEHNEYQGSVIIGSSNLTHNGLEGNREINAQLKDTKSLNDAMRLFETIWSEAVALTEDDFDKFIIKRVPKPKTLSPHQLYIKLLIEHFGSRIDFLDDEGISIPNGYKKLSYQIEAVNEGVEKLDRHNGFFLSDVVGLGKTVVVVMIIQKLNIPTLIVSPPSIIGQWRDTLDSFGITNYEIVSYASLEKIDRDKFGLVVVDEAHKFKNIKSKRYIELSQITKDKKVILLSATPQNNSPKDLQAQLNLFENMRHSTIDKCRDLDSFFNSIEPLYKEIIKSDDMDREELKLISAQIRDMVLREVMIRRTRSDISSHKMYIKEFKAQNLSLPKVKPIVEHEYKMSNILSALFKNTTDILIEKLKYERFNALSYLTLEAREEYYPNDSDNIFISNQLGTLMQNLLIKRFESSFYAFNLSINRQLDKYKSFISNFKDGKIYMGEKASDMLDLDEDSSEYDDMLDRYIADNKIKILSPKDFNSEYLQKLEEDIKILQRLVTMWSENTQDPKFDKFVDELNSKAPKQKIVVFTESKDTLKYLQSQLTKTPKILFISSQNRDRYKDIIRENFDANYIGEHKDDYDIIITTDTLAEGINLHRSSTIYNYDIPWNATKLIQRIGRVNRIGTKEPYIYIHNFKPSIDIENSIKLSQKAFVKLQSFHTTFGEDSKIYTQDEEVFSVELFNKNVTKNQERDEILDFLEELREFRESNPKEYKYIKDIDIEVGYQIENKALLQLPNNYIRVEDNKVDNIEFISMAKELKSDTKKDIKPIDKDTKDKISLYIEDRAKEKEQNLSENKIDDKLSQKAMNILKESMKLKFIDRAIYKRLKESISDGTLGIVAINKINSLKGKPKDEVIRVIEKIIS